MHLPKELAKIVTVLNVVNKIIAIVYNVKQQQTLILLTMVHANKHLECTHLSIKMQIIKTGITNNAIRVVNHVQVH